MKKILKGAFFVSVFFISSLPVDAKAKFFYLGTGATLLNMGKNTVVDDASTSLMGELYFPLTLQLPIRFSSQFLLIPHASYTPFSKKVADEVTKKIITAGLNAAFQTGPILQFKTGLGYLAYSVGGPGGTVTRSNGASTATYALPGTTVTAKTFYVDLGLGIRLGETFRVDLDGMVLGALTTRRSFSAIASLSAGVF